MKLSCRRFPDRHNRPLRRSTRNRPCQRTGRTIPELHVVSADSSTQSANAGIVARRLAVERTLPLSSGPGCPSGHPFRVGSACYAAPPRFAVHELNDALVRSQVGANAFGRRMDERNQCQRGARGNFHLFDGGGRFEGSAVPFCFRPAVFGIGRRRAMVGRRLRRRR